ncbi:hypothetical protein [Pseudovibrio sp. Ad37]|uniref:InvB/SpaK family type III secretion system chaperone n=1 Tax=Pseudovibrio sp. Ad37 TaxID=989422 RepID=UPI0007AEE01F|nr:hypothetical protein [Pseudovibrio sp. Ad37]KZL24074.1 Surface presentation of antigens protein SpaK [Pseudovibrio sp. Ad37]
MFNRLVTDLLAGLGFSDDKIRKVSLHQTVTVQLQDGPDIMLSVDEGRYWIWSRIPHIEPVNVTANAERILHTLIQPIIGIEGGQLQLGFGEPDLELKGLLNIEYILSGEDKLKTTFAAFHTYVAEISTAVGN